MKKDDTKKILIILTILTLISPSILEAAISGVVEYSYSSFLIKDSSKSSSHGQNYSIAKNGYLLFRNIGTYNIGFGYGNTISTSTSKSSKDGTHYDSPNSNSSDTYNYNFSSSLLSSTFSPVTISFSKFTTSQDSTLNPNTRGTAFQSNTETDSYRFTWRLIPKRRLPTMNSSFNITNTSSKSEFNPVDDSRQSLKLDINKGGLRTMYRINYGFENFENRSATKTTTKSHSISANINRLISRRTTLSGGAGFNKSKNSDSFNLLANLFVRHTRKIDSSYSYSFNIAGLLSDEIETSNSNNFSVNTRYTPTSKLRGNMNYNFTHSNPNKTMANTLSIGSSYRVTELWNTNVSTSTTRSRGSDNDNFSNSFTAGTNYSKPFKHVKVGTSYNFSYNLRESDRKTPPTTTIRSTADAGAAAKISVHPNNFNFWNVKQGSSSPSEVITITNEANTASKDKSLIISSITLTDNVNFSIDLFGGDSHCGNSIKVLGEGEKCTFAVTFTPQIEEGTISTTTVLIGYSDPNISTLTIDISGGENKMSSKKIISSNSSNSVSLSLSSVTLKKIGLSLSSRMSSSTSISDGDKTGSESFSTSLGIRTDLWKYLSLSNSTTYSNTLSGTRTQQLVTNVTYSLTIPFLENLVIASGYSYTTNFAGNVNSHNNNNYSVATSFSRNLTRSLRFSVALRRSWNGTPGGDTSAVNVITPKLTYKIGMLTFLLNSAMDESKTSGSSKSYSLNYNLNFKVSRRF